MLPPPRATSFTAPRFADILRLGATRWPSFAFSVAAAFGVNLVAMFGFAVAAAWRGPPIAAADGVARIAAIALAPARAADATPPPTVRKRIVAAHTALPAPLVAMLVPLPARSINAAGSSMRFYRSDEVDLPAQPDSDWNLDAVTLAEAGLSALVFDMLIGPQGEVISCTIVGPDVLRAELREALEGRLRQTVLQPALKAGEPVASVRRIEVSVFWPSRLSSNA